MKASPKITPHDSIESARDLSNNTAMQGEKIELENTLNSTSFAEVKQLSDRTQKKLAKRKSAPAQSSEDEKQADDTDRLFEIAIDRLVIGSLPSQVHLAMKAWIERNQLLKLRDESVLKFCKWLVGNGEYDSVNLFISSLNCYENQMNPIRVKNFGLGDEWSQVEEDSTRQKLLKKYQVKIIDFLSLIKDCKLMEMLVARSNGESTKRSRF